jgi:AAA+ superfamily predicted ATPase
MGRVEPKRVHSVVSTSVDNQTSSVHSLFVESLLPALQRLDERLEQAVRIACKDQGSEAASDLFQGFYVSDEEVATLLAQEPGIPLFPQFDPESAQKMLSGDWVVEGSRLAWLQKTYQLSLFDLDLLLVALAPELDRRYERLYAYLHDHVNRRWPTVDLAFHLLCQDAVERLERRRHLDADAPLVRNGLIHLISEPQTQPSLLAKAIKLDEQIVRFLLHQDSLDSRLTSFCQLLSPDNVGPLSVELALDQALLDLIVEVRKEERPLRLYFRGPDSAGKWVAVTALASTLDVPLLCVDLSLLMAADVDFVHTLQLMLRHALFYDALLYIDGLDSLTTSDQQIRHRLLMDALAQAKGVVILTGTDPWVPAGKHALGMVTIPFAVPDVRQRRVHWSETLGKIGATLEPSDLNALTERFSLTPNQIVEATLQAQIYAHLHRNGQGRSTPISPGLDDLFTAARAQSGHELATLTRKVKPLYVWDDIVLPEDALAQLHEICQWVSNRHLVLGEWGFNRKLSLGKGVNVLFAGPSGAGKTMAAEIIANELGLDLYKIDLAGVVSKYIGETEKNLDRIFSAAQNANAILFFDEADALFGKRSEVSDSHDRYANIEISYLLQKMEEYDGITILATNLRQNLDDAFIRRMAFAIHFPFPDAENRRRIWERIWPSEVPLSKDIDLDFVAERFKLSGGNIKNVALAAAFLAAAEGRAINMRHLIQAVRREYQKVGQVMPDPEPGIANARSIEPS